MCVCTRVCVCAWSDGINSGLGGPVGSCWEQETGADMAAWCTRRLKWDETTWPPEEPINYTKYPATVKLVPARMWQISEECLDPAQPCLPYLCLNKEKDDKVNWEKPQELKCLLPDNEVDFPIMHEILHKHTERRERAVKTHRERICVRESQRLTVTGRIFNRALSWEYCRAAAEMLGMLMLLLIMQLCETGQKYTNTRSSTSETNTLAKANTTENFHFYISTI